MLCARQSGRRWMFHFRNISTLVVGLLALCVVCEAVETYNLGGLFSLTYTDGSVAQWGVDSKDAMLLAVSEINAQEAATNSTFRLIVAPENLLDSKCDPASSKAKADTLLQRETPLHALLGVDCSGVYEVISEEYAEAQVPVLSYGSGCPNFSSPTTYPYFLRSIPSDLYTAHALSSLVANFQWSQIGLIFTTDPFGTGAAELVMNEAKQKGFSVVAAVSFDREAPDTVVQEKMLKLKNANLKIILISAPVPETRDVFKAATVLNMTGKGYVYLATEVVGKETIEDPQAFQAAEGYLATMPSGGSGQMYSAFTQKFETAFGRQPDRWAGFSYDMVFALAAGIRLKQKDTNLNLISAVRRARVTNGPTGEFYFVKDTNDRNGLPYSVLNLQGEKFVDVGTVFPSGKFQASGQPIIWPGGGTNPPQHPLHKKVTV